MRKYEPVSTNPAEGGPPKAVRRKQAAEGGPPQTTKARYEAIAEGNSYRIINHLEQSVFRIYFFVAKRGFHQKVDAGTRLFVGGGVQSFILEADVCFQQAVFGDTRILGK